MIKIITEEQKAKLPEYVDKWVSYASSPVDFLKAKESIEKMYVLMKKKKPTILIANGPIDAFWSAVAVQLMCKDKKAISTLYSTLYSTLDSTLGSTLYSTLDSTLRSTLYSTLGSTLKEKTDERVKKAKQTAYDSLYISQYWSWWAGFYDYADMIGVKFDEEKKNLFLDFCREIPFIYCMEGLSIICHKPEISWKELSSKEEGPKNRILYNEKGPSIKYRDGFELYHLNNILMKKEHIATPSEKIDVQDILKETNVDVRRELIRKVGMERFIEKSGAKVLDKKGHYEVLSIELSDEVPDARYLKMKNPSIGVWHVEGIESECDTVEKAINWRAGNIKEKWEPSILT